MKHRPELRTGGRVVTFDCDLIIPAAGMKRLREDDCVFMFSSDIKTVSARGIWLSNDSEVTSIE